MGYKKYSPMRMQSPLSQKSKSKKNWEDEDRNLTMEEVKASKDATAYKPYEEGAKKIFSDTSLSGNQQDAKVDQLYKKYEDDSRKAQQFSIDSMGRATSADLKKFTDNYDFANKSVDQYDADLLDFEKKGRWKLKKK